MNTLDTTPDTSPVDVGSVRKAVLAAIEADGTTRRQVAAESGVPEGTFGPFLSGTYKGDNERVARQAQSWLDLRAERQDSASVMPPPPSFQDTLTSRKIFGVLSRSQQVGDLCVIGMGPGVGKTATCHHYRATRPNVWHVTMRPSTAGVTTCLIEVLRAMGEPNAKGSPQGLANRVADRVRNNGSLLIIDEAQNLLRLAVEELRGIHDQTGCGLAFVGDERLFAIFGGSRSGEFAQLSSRIGMRLRQMKPRTEDVTTLAAAHGIADARLIALCNEIAQKPGALRGMTKTLLLARQTAAAKGQPLTERLVRAAWANLAPDQVLSQIGGAA